MKVTDAARSYNQTSRADSTEATGQRIVGAFLARLMEQWFDEITLDRVAEDADVTVQTIVRRFGSKEGLLKSAVEQLAPQIRGQREAPAGNIERLVEKLVRDYERTGDAIIRLLALEPRQAALKTFLDFGRKEHRDWVSGAFGGLLNHLEPATRLKALDALVVSTDVYTWKLLRRDMLRTVRATTGILKTLIQAVLTEYTSKNLKGKDYDEAA